MFSWLVDSDPGQTWPVIATLWAMPIVFFGWSLFVVWLLLRHRLPFRGLAWRFVILTGLLGVLRVLLAHDEAGTDRARNGLRLLFLATACEAAYRLWRTLPIIHRYPSPNEAGSACQAAQALVEEIVAGHRASGNLNPQKQEAAQRTIETLQQIALRLRETP